MIKAARDKLNNLSRNEKGESLISLLVAISISSFVAVGLFGLAYLNNYSSSKLTNKCDSINSARQCIERLGRQIRMARSIGNMYGLMPPASSPSVNYSMVNHGTTTNTSALNPWSTSLIDSINNGTAAVAYPQFPSPGDPFYASPPSFGTGIPPQGWPGAGTDAVWQTRPYIISSTCLIVQVPVFDLNGLPQGIILSDSGTKFASVEALDTYVYQVVPDLASDAAPGTWMMQCACFPAQGITRNSGWQGSSQPITILRGIIGPYDPGADPTSASRSMKVFQYVSSVNGLAYDNLSSNPADPNTVFNVSGIAINLEILKQEAGKNKQSSLQFRTEIYLRNNTDMTPST